MKAVLIWRIAHDKKEKRTQKKDEKGRGGSGYVVGKDKETLDYGHCYPGNDRMQQ